MLLENAIKFTDRGGLTISLYEGVNTEGDKVTYFEVQDTGIGIAPEQLSRLFEPFTQADGSSTRRHGGVGLGLALGHSLAARMGGRLTADSTPGRGSRFSLTLPLPRLGFRGPTSSPVPARARLRACCAGLRMLLVTPNEILGEIWTEMLRNAGFKLQRVEDSAAAVVAFRQARYELVLIDIGLSDPEEPALAPLLRALPGGEAVPILLVGAADLEQLAPNLGAGVYGSLDSIATPDQLYEEVLHALEGRARAAG